MMGVIKGLRARLTVLDDPGRLEALRRTGLLDAPGDEVLDRLARLAQRLLDAPLAAISLVDDRRQVFAGQSGLPPAWSGRRQMPLSHSFCQHVVRGRSALVVEDARVHPELSGNPAIAELDVVAYLGVPLAVPGGAVLGSLCVIDVKPRRWSDADVDLLSDLATSVMNEIALRQELALRREAEAARELMVGELNHRVRNLFTLILGLVGDQVAGEPAVRAYQAALIARLKALVRAHALVFESAAADGAMGENALMSAVAEAALAGIAGAERVTRRGDGATLSGRQALYATLVLHELGLNALKHGALSQKGGTVSLTWRSVGEELYFDWVERGGPAPPKQQEHGFGMELIEIVTAGSRRPDKAMEFAAEGLTARLGMKAC